jgi:hypothetical protein
MPYAMFGRQLFVAEYRTKIDFVSKADYTTKELWRAA